MWVVQPGVLWLGKMRMGWLGVAWVEDGGDGCGHR